VLIHVVMDDGQLLREYVVSRSEVAFRTLVERYISLVYGAARRLLDDPGQAEDVTQAVFVILARKASTLPTGTILSGWLYRATRFTADKARRAEYRRHLREQEAVQMQSTVNDSDWSRLAPILEDAMTQLQLSDRNAILLRFFENKSLRDVGHALGISEDTAQKRVARAIIKLRGLLVKEGVPVSSGAMTASISAHAMPIVSAQISATVAAMGLGHQGVSAGVQILAKTKQFSGFRLGTIAGSLAAFLFLATGLIFLRPILGRHFVQSLSVVLSPAVTTNRPALEAMPAASSNLQIEGQIVPVSSSMETAHPANVRVKVKAPGPAQVPIARGMAAIRLNLTGTPRLRFGLVYSHDGDTRTINGVLPAEVSFKADAFSASITIDDPGQFGFEIYRNNRLAVERPASDTDANRIVLIETANVWRGFQFSVK